MRWIFFVMVCSSAAVVEADAIDGPPACPPGSRGRSSHAGQWCVPAPCTSNADCQGGSCRPWRVCTRIASVPQHRRGPESPPISMELVVGTCDPSAACRGDEEPPPSIVGTLVMGAPACTEAQYCVPQALPRLPEAPPEPGPMAERPSGSPRSAGSTGGACGCAGAPASAAPLSVLAIGLAYFYRRRR